MVLAFRVSAVMPAAVFIGNSSGISIIMIIAEPNPVMDWHKPPDNDKSAASNNATRSLLSTTVLRLGYSWWSP